MIYSIIYLLLGCAEKLWSQNYILITHLLGCGLEVLTDMIMSTAFCDRGIIIGVQSS